MKPMSVHENKSDCILWSFDFLFRNSWPNDETRNLYFGNKLFSLNLVCAPTSFVSSERYIHNNLYQCSWCRKEFSDVNQSACARARVTDVSPSPYKVSVNWWRIIRNQQLEKLKRLFFYKVTVMFLMTMFRVFSAVVLVCVCSVCVCERAERADLPRDFGVKLCGREFIRAVIFTCGGSRWRRSDTPHSMYFITIIIIFFTRAITKKSWFEIK